jgi:hypothetical protein
MKARYRLAALGATLLAGMVGTGGTVMAATTTHATPAQVNRCCWDHRGHRGDWDRGGWRGRDWDHRGSGWNWEQQCDWAYYNDRGWWYANCS